MKDVCKVLTSFESFRDHKVLKKSVCNVAAARGSNHYRVFRGFAPLGGLAQRFAAAAEKHMIQSCIKRTGALVL